MPGYNNTEPYGALLLQPLRDWGGGGDVWVCYFNGLNEDMLSQLKKKTDVK